MSASASNDSASLVRQLQAGTASERDQERLFKRFYPRAYGNFRRRGFAPEDAEDLAQETLVQAFEKIADLRQPEQFGNWLFSISVNIFRNELRRRSRHKADAPALSIDAAIDQEGAPAIALEDDAPRPDDELLDKEQRQLLRRVIDQLPPQMRQCVKLRFEQGLKYRQIAAVLKISIDTVKAHLSQARKRLTDKMGSAVATGAPE
jgi:RNA polymerase sigma factor (sigma-70 family)